MVKIYDPVTSPMYTAHADMTAVSVYFYQCFMCLYGCGLSTFNKLPSDLT